MRLVLRIFALSFFVSSACGDDPQPKTANLAPCQTDDECESGACRLRAGQLMCTATCNAVGAYCESQGLDVCQPDLTCGEPCYSNTVPEGTACVFGLQKDCADAPPASFCDVCGCAAGNVCIMGTGCVEQKQLGEACTRSAVCKTQACDIDTKTCVEAKADGEACLNDGQCKSANCSNGGRIGIEGVCYQQVFSACERNSSTCARCVEGANSRICARTSCDPVRAPCGPGWECKQSEYQGFQCFESCAQTGFCFDFYAECNTDKLCY